MTERPQMSDAQLLQAGLATLMPDEFDAIIKELIALRARVKRSEDALYGTPA